MKKLFDDANFWKGATLGGLIMLLFHFLWITKGGC